MKQMSFADAEYAGKRKQTRREHFLIEMHQVVPWKGLITLIEPHYPKGEGGRPAYPLLAMLRVHLMQNWFGYGAVGAQGGEFWTVFSESVLARVQFILPLTDHYAETVEVIANVNESATIYRLFSQLFVMENDSRVRVLRF